MTSRYMAVCAVVLFVAQCRAAELQPQPRVEVYRATIDDHDFPASPLSEAGFKWCRVHVTQEYLAQHAKAVGEPILTDSDISEYCWNRQWLRLTDAAAARWNSALRERRSLAGQFFVVLVDSTYCYTGMVWSMASSLSPPPVPILVEMAINGVVWTNVNGDMLGTPLDARYDERVKQALAQLGKLTAECAEDWWK